VAAVPLADAVPALVLPGVWVCCVDTEPPVGGNSRDGGKTSVLERLGVTGPLGLGDRAGAPLPMPVVVDPELDAPPDADDPDEVCESAAEEVKASANAAVIAVLMAAPLRGKRWPQAIVPAGAPRASRVPIPAWRVRCNRRTPLSLLTDFAEARATPQETWTL
jgi:hypothetical protein